MWRSWIELGPPWPPPSGRQIRFRIGKLNTEATSTFLTLLSVLKAFWGGLGSVLGCLETVLGGLQEVLGPSWQFPNGLFIYFGMVFGFLGAVLDGLRAILGRSWGGLGRSWNICFGQALEKPFGPWASPGSVLCCLDFVSALVTAFVNDFVTASVNASALSPSIWVRCFSMLILRYFFNEKVVYEIS